MIMSQPNPIQPGDCFIRKAGMNWLRVVLSVSDDARCLYGELLDQDSDVHRGVTSFKSMKTWGRKITTEEAVAIYPTMQQRLAGDKGKFSMKRNRETPFPDQLSRMLSELTIWCLDYDIVSGSSDRLLIEELNHRGYEVTKRQ